jgi:hypothetical protein
LWPGGNADKTDLAEARGFFNFVVFNNCVENLRITTDFLAAARPFRDHRRFSAIIGVTWSDADDISPEVRLRLIQDSSLRSEQFSNETI